MRILRYMLLAALVPVLLFFAVGLFSDEARFRTRLPVTDAGPVWQRFSQPEQLGRLVGEPVRLRPDGVLAWQLLDDQGQPRARLQYLKLEPGRSLVYRVEGEHMTSEGRLNLYRDHEGQAWLESEQRLRGEGLFWRAVLRLSVQTMETRHRADLVRVLAGEIDNSAVKGPAEGG